MAQVQLWGDITTAEAQRVCAELTASPGSMLTMNSGGGNVEDGYALHDAVRISEAVCRVTGRCYSMAVLVLQGAVRREATANTRFYLHPVHVQLQQVTTVNDLALLRDDLKALEVRYVDILYARASEVKGGASKRRLQQMVRTHQYLWAADALRLGLIDLVVS